MSCSFGNRQGRIITGTGRSHEELLARIGRDYYVHNHSKVEIARSYGISRFQVARYLDEARALGIVHIDVRFPSTATDLDPARLASSLGVEHVRITPTGQDDRATRDAMARGAAAELASAAFPGATVGISWSRTLDLAAQHVTSLPPCDVVQLTGALPVPGSGNSLELIQGLGRHDGVRTWPLWAPLVVENKQTADSLRRQPEIADTLRKADTLDAAVVAVGAWMPGLSTVWNRVDNRLRLESARAGAVAECSGRLLDASGNPVDSELDERVLAVTVAQLQHTPKVVAVAQGAARAEAVRAVLAAGFVTTLLIDEELAVALSGTAGRDPEATAKR
ncbi:sugar-binding transcriptional regulator [Arthrobacter caoxuetaonis]|uniref:Cro/Cl family transcriptional regulator n=1 Tax=Arthrobacter caoxuetaonis TaxID=2886935 RepID=A0A9X1MGM1_9MICC|nr:sugar-binding domain-containing protein [Arthrobacter caoxuetaonis]MCC3298219.1 Cro/Cl family transcriptional regulator [Arthrobacter caoxuetaonis]USQ57220.1 Cro/Cl family transcriptional regulator [Arthrobacter caoxuetaonis]